MSCLTTGLGAIVPRLAAALVTSRASFPWGKHVPAVRCSVVPGWVPSCFGRDGVGPRNDTVLDRRGAA